MTADAVIDIDDGNSPHPYSDVVVIGGGQAGLSGAYYLQHFGLTGRYQLLDAAPSPGGAWQFRWPTLTLAGTNRVHDLPGFGLVDALGEGEVRDGMVRASSAVPRYYAMYEDKFGLAVYRPHRVRSVRRDESGFVITLSDGFAITSRTLINATGTWERPFVPHVPGIDEFVGRQLHTHDYTGPSEFAGKRVLVVGAGISAVQLLIEIARNAPGVQTFWTSRTEPVFGSPDFSPERGREAVARVDKRVRAGLPPTSVVSVTGLPLTPAIADARADGILSNWQPMFGRITPTGVAWDCGPLAGETLNVDVIFWNTGFRSSLDHLSPLRLRGPGGGIVMTGRLATTVQSDPRIQLIGYGPSASTIGANRAGREAARNVAELLGDSV